jgi:hypothetical protein
LTLDHSPGFKLRPERTEIAMQTMTIGRLATAAGFNVDTIRYCERHGLLPHASRRASSYRRWAHADVASLDFNGDARSWKH